MNWTIDGIAHAMRPQTEEDPQVCRESGCRTRYGSIPVHPVLAADRTCPVCGTAAKAGERTNAGARLEDAT